MFPGDVYREFGEHGPLTSWQSMRESAARISLTRQLHMTPTLSDVDEFTQARQGILAEIAAHSTPQYV